MSDKKRLVFFPVVFATIALMLTLAYHFSHRTRPLHACAKSEPIFVELGGDVNDTYRSGDEYDIYNYINPEIGVDIKFFINELGKPVCYQLIGYQQTADLPIIAAKIKKTLEKFGAKDFGISEMSNNGRSFVRIVRLENKEPPKPKFDFPESIEKNDFISLERTMCLGTCPVYSVKIYADGRVEFIGRHFVSVFGEQYYRIPIDKASRLFDFVRDNQISSSKSKYIAEITDGPSHFIELSLASKKIKIVDYLGREIAMPHAITELERMVDKAAQTDRFLTINQDTLDFLKDNNFDFRSNASGGILAAAIADSQNDNERAILDLLDLGAPTRFDHNHHFYFNDDYPDKKIEAADLLARAIIVSKYKVANALIDSGVLKTDEKIDKSKLNKAFKAAIRNGNFKLVQKLWDYGNDKITPDLTFLHNDLGFEGPQTYSVITLVNEIPSTNENSGLKIVKFLHEKGCEINSASINGESVLANAVRADDFATVHYLLLQGIDVNKKYDGGMPVLYWVHSEEMALILLKSGAEWKNAGFPNNNFETKIESEKWLRAKNWLEKAKSKRNQ